MNRPTSSVEDPTGQGSANHKVPGLWRAIAGFGVWALAFVVLYVGHAVACLYVLPETTGAWVVRAGLTVIWLMHLAVLVLMVWRSTRLLRRARSGPSGKPSNAEFLVRITAFLDVFALGAVFVNGLPVVLMQACAM